jgi:hypothetical protein
MKRRILVTGTDHHFSLNLSLDASCPDFYDSFSSEEFELVAELPADFLISFNHNPREYKRFIFCGGEKSRSILIRLEPECVYPAQYRERVISKYGLVLSPGRPTSVSSGAFIRWPYTYNKNPSNPDRLKSNLREMVTKNQGLFTWDSWNTREIQVSLIAANKVSPISKSNYLLRKRLAQKLTIHGFAVHGPLWEFAPLKRVRQSLVVGLVTIKQGTIPNLLTLFRYSLSHYPASKGKVEDKHEILKASKYTLVIENSNEIVTEKLFDAIINGAIPLYIGPLLSSVGLPPEIAIEIRGAEEEVYKALGEHSEAEVQAKLNAMSEFISSRDFLGYWSSEVVFGNLAQRSVAYFEESNK